MSMNGRLDNGQLEAEAKAIRRLKAEWKIQNECIADQHDEISKLKSINAELLTACELAFKKLSGFAPETANARTIIEAAIANAQPQE